MMNAFPALQERSQAAASAVRLLDDKLSRQLSNIRTDTKQAITVATSVACGGLKAEIHADMDSKARENERSMKHELAGEKPLECLADTYGRHPNNCK